MHSNIQMLFFNMPTDYTHLVTQDNQETPENLHKVNKQVNRMPYVVIITTRVFLNNHLSVKQDQSTEHN